VSRSRSRSSSSPEPGGHQPVRISPPADEFRGDRPRRGPTVVKWKPRRGGSGNFRGSRYVENSVDQASARCRADRPQVPSRSLRRHCPGRPTPTRRYGCRRQTGHVHQPNNRNRSGEIRTSDPEGPFGFKLPDARALVEFGSCLQPVELPVELGAGGEISYYFRRDRLQRAGEQLGAKGSSTIHQIGAWGGRRIVPYRGSDHRIRSEVH
jgi:hypothetical protein